MAKRKRLTPANPALFGAEAPAPETKTVPLSRAPIAEVASEAAATAALDRMAQELSEARAGGRMVLELPLAQIVLDHLVRDRIVAEDAEMQTLMASIAARGQQTPVEVMDLGTAEGGARYGLISGWRRCQAIAALAEDGRHPGTVLALLRRPSEASEAYLSMVEENEIRVGLSYFERARIALKAVQQGVFESEKAALLTLFAAASRPKRSKIRSFLPLVRAFDGALGFPHLIGERLGLRLAAALEANPVVALRIVQALRDEAPETGEAEQALIQRVLAAAEQMVFEPEPEAGPDTVPDTVPSPAPDGTPDPAPAAAPGGAGHAQIGADLAAEWDEGGCWLRFSGPRMDPALRARIIDLVRRIPR